ncbi:MAG: hydrogenase expression/formation protein HypE [Nitrospina sp.]|jgi:hydrogenase expression/formation protein HypE|nr:hydrogenase expression/formation protein HypE [Nitrospina sp.]MBT5633102.1 hydrogenase expression/formation protein HypE [Nitrospina sp.]
MSGESNGGFSCPLPFHENSVVTLAHGGGGNLTRQLIEKIFKPAFNNPDLETEHDSAIIQVTAGRLAFTTDSYVVQPLIFPGGDIGSLAVNGTVNDLAMSGARPLYLSVGFILEEGLPMETLWTVVQSMKRSAISAEVKIITGDTKVVDKGKGDGIFINTSGVGVIEPGVKIHPRQVQPGDAVLLSGDIARHGMAIMSARKDSGFQNQIESDCASVSGEVRNLLDVEVHCLRDLTRGGLATALIEIARSAEVSIDIEESEIPVCEDVKGACEILGFDPLYVANEGRFIALVHPKDEDRALHIMKKTGNDARIIGRVKESPEKRVTLKTRAGSIRMLSLLSGEQLPRIC